MSNEVVFVRAGRLVKKTLCETCKTAYATMYRDDKRVCAPCYSKAVAQRFTEKAQANN